MAAAAAAGGKWIPAAGMEVAPENQRSMILEQLLKSEHPQTS